LFISAIAMVTIDEIQAGIESARGQDSASPAQLGAALSVK